MTLGEAPWCGVEVRLGPTWFLALFLLSAWGCSLSAPPPSTPRDAGPAARDAGPSPDADLALDAGAADAGLDAGEVDGGELLDAGEIPDAGDAGPDASAPDAAPRVVILMIGDGMGNGQLEAASRYAHGRHGALRMEQLPHRGEILTASLSGLTDSGASATSMATGVKTTNRRIGMDRNRQPLETLVELAHRRGLAAGIVTSALLPHATPAGFSAHWPDRDGYVEIAASQVNDVRPEVLLGGGARYFLPAGQGSARSDSGLIAPLMQAGFQLATTRDELSAADPAGGRILGIFAPDHMGYVRERSAGDPQPSLTEMSLAAIRFLERRSEGFFLMIEGARIDMASHLNDLPNTVAETLDFDEAVGAVLGWASDKAHVTVLVTADHECGGLAVTEPRPAGTLSEVSWEWDQHTNDRVQIFGQGPGSELFHQQLRDNTWIHAVSAARLEGRPVTPPSPGLVPDGHLADLRHRAALQGVQSGFGPSYNRLDALWLDADDRFLAIGLEGLFQRGQNSVVVLIDVDLGAGSGPAAMRGALSDNAGRADRILTALSVVAPPVSGFGVDFAAVAWGGVLARDEDLSADTGLRGVRPPYGEPGNLGWYAVPANFGEGVRTRAGQPGAPVVGEGLEIFIPWRTLYPPSGGLVPSGATLGIAVVLVNDDGGFTSNQALPPFGAGTENPGRTAVALPGVVRFEVDADGDGIADGNHPPQVLP